MPVCEAQTFGHLPPRRRLNSGHNIVFTPFITRDIGYAYGFVFVSSASTGADSWLRLLSWNRRVATWLEVRDTFRYSVTFSIRADRAFRVSHLRLLLPVRKQQDQSGDDRSDVQRTWSQSLEIRTMGSRGLCRQKSAGRGREGRRRTRSHRKCDKRFSRFRDDCKGSSLDWSDDDRKEDRYQARSLRINPIPFDISLRHHASASSNIRD